MATDGLATFLTADEAEQEALDTADEVQALLALVRVPRQDRADWLPERLSFLLARDNYVHCLAALRVGNDIAAGNLARALFEEAMRWSWVDEDVENRRTAFLGAAAHRHRQVDEAARQLGIDPGLYYGPLVAEVVDVSKGASRFPGRVQDQLDWAAGHLADMMYAQYRLFSQYTHSSLLAIGSAVTERDGQLAVGRLPQVARMTILRNVVANMAVIVDGCKQGLDMSEIISAAPPSFLLFGYSARVAAVLQEFAPATE